VSDAGFPLQISDPTEERYGKCRRCRQPARWWPPEAEAEGRWVHTEPWMWKTQGHRAEVAE
jgi:hypothetical protein